MLSKHDFFSSKMTNFLLMEFANSVDNLPFSDSIFHVYVVGQASS